MRIQADITVAAPRGLVWGQLVDWEAQADWMVDARAVRVLTDARTGEGVTLCVPTRVLGVTVDDVMRVTAWQPPERLEVAHLGRVIRGTGAFELAPIERGTAVTWWEEVDPPLGAAGRWGARRLVRPVVQRLFTRSLRRLRERCEAAVAPTVGRGAAA